MTEQRKLAAVMFTDIVGYTALMSKDEQKAMALLKKNRELQKALTKKHNGEFLKEMGDGILLCFQSTLDAVYCALEIQRTVKDDPDLDLRIGIHSGDVIFKDGDVFGDGVNVASRIENLADAGGILISDQVYKTIRNKPEIKAVPLGEKRLKNVEHPVKVYALTGEGLPEHRVKSFQDDTVKKPVKKFIPVLALVGVVVLILGSVWIFTRGDKTYRDKWIAVLPFDPITRAVEDTIFCDGIHDALLTQLQKIKDLHPLSRSTMITYRNSGKRPLEIARELGVSHVIEGSVQRIGSRILITVQLIDGRTDDHVWADDYEVEYTDIFSVQRQVAQSVARECKAKITTEEKIVLEQIPTQNIEALECYQRGKWYWDNKASTKGNKQAAHFLEKAVSLDSSFALAWAKLSLVHTTLYYDYFQGESHQKRAKTALTRAEEIDPHLPETQVARGHLLQWKGESSKAIEMFNKALAGSPNNSQYYLFRGYSFIAQGQIDKALDDFIKGYELNPNEFSGPRSICDIYVLQRKWSEADKFATLLIRKHPENIWGYLNKAIIFLNGYGQIDKARTILDEGWNLVDEPVLLFGLLWQVEILARDYEAALEIIERGPEYPAYPRYKADTFSLMGKVAEAGAIFDSLRVEYEQLIKIEPDIASYHIRLGWNYVNLGRNEEAIREVKKAVELNPNINTYEIYWVTQIYIKAGEYDKAIDRIKMHLAEPNWDVTRWSLKLDPLYDPLRGDPRFQKLVE